MCEFPVQEEIKIKENEELADKIIKEPFSLYLLYSLSAKETQFDLPPFIDRGKEIQELKSMGLVEQDEKKHQHDKMVKLTRTGRQIAELFTRNGTFSKLQHLSHGDREAFLCEYADQFLAVHEYMTSYESEEILQWYELPPIGKSRDQKHLSITIRGWKKLSHMDLYYMFLFDATCKGCGKTFARTQLLQYFEEEYRPKEFEFSCPQCNRHFSVDSQFTRFSILG